MTMAPSKVMASVRFGSLLSMSTSSTLPAPSPYRKAIDMQLMITSREPILPRAGGG